MDAKTRVKIIKALNEADNLLTVPLHVNSISHEYPQATEMLHRAKGLVLKAYVKLTEITTRLTKL
jgi:hypothetical protein